jgi:hypothetical protein
MQQAQYGFCRLEVLVAMTTLAFRRLTHVLSAVTGPSRASGQVGDDLLVAVSADLQSALARRLPTLRSVFPGAAAPSLDGSGDVASLLAGLREVHRSWVWALGALADDNELDVSRPDASGRPRLTVKLVADAILEDAELAGRIAARLGS